MAKQPERRVVKQVKVSDLQVPPRPLCLWDDETASKLAEKSMKHGHRVLWFKCSQCTLEYQVRTWREGQDVAKHFPFCPECGAKGASYCIKTDHEIGPIFQAMHAPPPDDSGAG